MNQAIIDRSNQYLVIKSLRIQCYEGHYDIGEKVQNTDYFLKFTYCDMIIVFSVFGIILHLYFLRE